MLVVEVECRRLLTAHGLGISRWVVLDNLSLAYFVKSGPTTTSPALNTISSHVYLGTIPADISILQFHRLVVSFITIQPTYT